MSAPAIFKAFVIRSFFPKRLSCLCFGMSCFKNLPACSAGSGFRSSDTGIMERLKSFTHCCPNCKTLPPFPDRLPPAALPGSMRRSRWRCGDIFYKYTRDYHFPESSASAYAPLPDLYSQSIPSDNLVWPIQDRAGNIPRSSFPV